MRDRRNGLPRNQSRSAAFGLLATLLLPVFSYADDAPESQAPSRDVVLADVDCPVAAVSSREARYPNIHADPSARAAFGRSAAP